MITRIPLRTLLTVTGVSRTRTTAGSHTHRHNFSSSTQTIPQAHYNVVFDIDGVLIKVGAISIHNCHMRTPQQTEGAEKVRGRD